MHPRFFDTRQARSFVDRSIMFLAIPRYIPLPRADRAQASIPLHASLCDTRENRIPTRGLPLHGASMTAPRMGWILFPKWLQIPLFGDGNAAVLLHRLPQ